VPQVYIRNIIFFQGMADFGMVKTVKDFVHIILELKGRSFPGPYSSGAKCIGRDKSKNEQLFHESISMASMFYRFLM
jgi:hypothetical protein